jgi:hypothetical protein
VNDHVSFHVRLFDKDDARQLSMKNQERGERRG